MKNWTRISNCRQHGQDSSQSLRRRETGRRVVSRYRNISPATLKPRHSFKRVSILSWLIKNQSTVPHEYNENPQEYNEGGFTSVLFNQYGVMYCIPPTRAPKGRSCKLILAITAATTHNRSNEVWCTMKKESTNMSNCSVGKMLHGSE